MNDRQLRHEAVEIKCNCSQCQTCRIVQTLDHFRE